MATPQELTTTVSGRRCTRSRARTAVTSTLTSTEAVFTPTEFTSTSTTQEAAQIQTTTAEAPPPPPPPSSTSTTEAAQVAPPPETTSSTIAVTSDSSLSISTVPSTISTTQSAIAVLPSDPASSQVPSESSTADQPGQSQSLSQPEQAQPTDSGIPSGGEAGVISPDQGASGEGNGLTLPADGQTNVAGIAGGVAGGFVAIALISALLFLCLRRRKTGTFERWQRKMSEKSSGDSGFIAKIKAVPHKLQAIPAGVGILFAKIKGNKAGPSSNPYRRHTVRSSVSSVYSAGSNRRSQSISDPPPKTLRQQLRGFGDRMPSLKRSRTLLQKKQDSLIVGDRSPFPGIVDDPVLRNSKGAEDPFRDPVDPPKTFLLMNPDPASPRVDGSQEQQRGPLTPKPTAVSERSRDPFASIMDELEKRNGSGTPEWLKDTAQKHKRTTSAQTALRSHPPSTATISVYKDVENPFFDPSDAPPVPNQPLPPNPPPRAANAYGPLPAFNATSSTISRESSSSFYFGEPGPTRPGTDMFGGSRVRQSDPFDLDRPEVLSFGAVNGRGVRGSVTRQNSRARRSNVPNWVNVGDGPYERESAVPGPLRNPSVKR
ncbi:hypothetical protein K458DRAFT_414909 [Lentithecium fluviatile CBS 122367]|uniref:Uncharacterized protein n=1 Tax=Lentithecium fluviatile CBS 122367 TaxID=1168545 RepID=A0A6G1JCH2_9PLEO|nr:hypothetical protein K458DRAFT_414909 [Lentithecium fluviatile CBS 122367]